MSNLEQIEAAILSLPSNEFERLKLWLLDLDYNRWDEQLEQDVADGKLEALAQEAIAELKPITRDKQLRPIGLCAGEFTVLANFDASLPEDMLSAFE